MKKISPATIVTIIVGLAAFWAGDKTAWQVRSLHDSGMAWMEAATHILDDITNNPAHLSFYHADLLAGLAAVAVLGLALLYSRAQKQSTRHGEEYGSSAWGSAKDFKPFAGSDEEGIILTANHTLSLDTHKTGRNRNVLVYGSSGSGKSRYFVLPNLETCSTSFVVTDPKGELLRNSGQHLTDNGYKIRCLNLVDFTKSDRFNPFDYFDPRQAEISISILVNNIITNTTGGKPQGDQAFWERAEKALLTALIAYAYYDAKPFDKPSLIDVAEMLKQMSNDKDSKDGAGTTDEMFNMISINSKNGSYTEKQSRGLDFALSQYDIYRKGATETRQSVVISLGVRLASLYMAPMQTLISGKDEIYLEDVGREKTALFLILPDTHTTFNWLAAVFYQQLFETLINQADVNTTGSLDIPVQCFMDEFANIGQIPDFDKKIAVMRSRGISVAVILQSDAQGKSIYKDDWETIIGNCDSVLFLGGQEKSTTELISRLLGKQTIRVKNHNEALGTSGSSSRNWQKTGRELLTTDELARLDNKECIYILRGIKPFKAHKHDPATMKGTYIHIPGCQNSLYIPNGGREEDGSNNSGRVLTPAHIPHPDTVPTPIDYTNTETSEDVYKRLEDAVPGWTVVQ